AKEKGKKIKLYEVQNGRHEAILISRKIQELIKKEKAKFKDITVFYRTNAQSRLFETQFIKDHINYQIVGGVNFFQRKEIKDILAYLKVLANPSDNESLLRIINFPKRGIGKSTINRLIDFTTQNNISLFNSLQKGDKINGLSSSFSNKLRTFYLLMNEFKRDSEIKPINLLIKNIIKKLDLIEIYKKEELIKGETRADNIKEFITSTEEFYENYIKDFDIEPNLIEYLQNISLISDIDRTDKNDNVVSLMTMHNAKGLEFPYVYIVGVEDGLIPHRNSMESVSEIEEERRLLYVAITRTIKALTISYANSRRFFDSYITNFPSRFLNDISDEHLEKFILTSELDKEYPDSYYQFEKKGIGLKTDHKKFRVGQRIAHTEFGNGMILSIRGDGDLTKLTISFDSGELKKVISSYIKVL
ncbi:MAG: ATP-binding domain-containing protein, partial [Candidatus Cloacimonetes bacterium]|nr:ATP-binding domain-containing protein [Candidatus Cloacimonadota bacterium]